MMLLQDCITCRFLQITFKMVNDTYGHSAGSQGLPTIRFFIW